MVSNPYMLIIILGRHLLRSSPEGTWWYEDAMTWIAAVLALAWLAWFFVGRYLRARGLRRRPRAINYRGLKRTAKIKRELSSRYLQPGFSGNIHAVGIGMLAGGNEYCLQVFINDPNQELWAGAGAATLPNSYRGIPVVLIEMQRAGFLSGEDLSAALARERYP
ncbi:MAG: hypothetical protein ACMG6H_15420, partial [Acidobacteriota bacterium]